ncbi:hypothetical protein APTSU1_001386700 [Apodemus speciosus]|uniref:Uncharacterized protein n=1 Tax=Apodemus speciosus TaxID=105296 RepID=A0ABQ0FHY3_APOSI
MILKYESSDSRNKRHDTATGKLGEAKDSIAWWKRYSRNATMYTSDPRSDRQTQQRDLVYCCELFQRRDFKRGDKEQGVIRELYGRAMDKLEVVKIDDDALLKKVAVSNSQTRAASARQRH